MIKLPYNINRCVEDADQHNPGVPRASQAKCCSCGAGGAESQAAAPRLAPCRPRPRPRARPGAAPAHTPGTTSTVLSPARQPHQQAGRHHQVPRHSLLNTQNRLHYLELVSIVADKVSDSYIYIYI